MNARDSWVGAVVALVLLLTLSVVTWNGYPGWFRIVFGTAIFVGLLLVVVRQQIELKRREEHGLQGRCSCGYDLRETPAKKTSRHSFDVWGRMSSTKKIVVCPECGKKQALWDHE